MEASIKARAEHSLGRKVDQAREPQPRQVSAPCSLLTLGIDTIADGPFSTVTRIALITSSPRPPSSAWPTPSSGANPVGFNHSHAKAVLLLALTATGSGEYPREMLRKPYVIGRWMYSNGVRVPSVARINAQGYLAGSQWIWSDSSGAPPSTYSRGEAIFRGECGSCHTMDGYRSMRKLMDGRDRASIHNFVVMLHDYNPDSPYHKFMPPMIGTAQDIDDLTDYLNTKVNPPGPARQAHPTLSLSVPCSLPNPTSPQSLSHPVLAATPAQAPRRPLLRRFPPPAPQLARGSSAPNR